MKGITTYLHFHGDCRAAMSFYRECFGGALEIMAFPDATGAPDTAPDAPVMHSKLALDGQTLLMGSDYPSDTDTPGLGRNFAVFIDCSTGGELDGLFAGLSKDGRVTVPPSDLAAGRFAMCDDSFGVSWILNCAADGGVLADGAGEGAEARAGR